MLVILVGPTCSGKTSVANELVEKHGFTRILTYTTRKPRSGEHNGEDYWFISEEEFSLMDEQNLFIETKAYHASFGDVRYGSVGLDYLTTPGYPQNKVVVLDPEGNRKIRDIFKDQEMFTVLLNPDEETLVRRGLARGDTPEEISRRIAEDESELIKLYYSRDYELVYGENLSIINFLAEDIANNIVANADEAAAFKKFKERGDEKLDESDEYFWESIVECNEEEKEC